MSSIAKLALLIDTLFTATAKELGRASGLFVRIRILHPEDFLKALVLGFLKRKDAPLEDLVQPLEVSRQALHQRLDCPEAPEFCRLALLHAVAQHASGRLPKFALLDRFNGVFLDDCTQAKLPDEAAEDWPGCGSGDGVRGKAALKVFARFEIRSGSIAHIGIHAGKASDHAALAEAPPLPAGCLHLADLGFCEFERLKEESAAGIHWITRLPANTDARLPGEDFGPLAGLLASWRKKGIKKQDIRVEAGREAALPGRLVAFACPPGVVMRRLEALEKDAKRRNREVTERQREFCRWTVLLTNLPEERLSADEAWRAYRLRWQVELLFKRFKSEGGLDGTRSGKRWVVESEWLLKLLSQVVRNWVQGMAGGPLRDVNGKQAGRVVADWADALLKALGGKGDVAIVLKGILRELLKIRKRTNRKKKPTDAQSLDRKRVKSLT